MLTERQVRSAFEVAKILHLSSTNTILSSKVVKSLKTVDTTTEILGSKLNEAAKMIKTI